MSKLSLGSGNRNSQRYFPGWKYTGAASVCGDYSDKFSPPEPLKQTFIVSQSWRLKSKTVVLAAHTPTKPPGQDPPCVPASTGSRHPLVEGSVPASVFTRPLSVSLSIPTSIFWQGQQACWIGSYPPGISYIPGDASLHITLWGWKLGCWMS